SKTRRPHPCLRTSTSAAPATQPTLDRMNAMKMFSMAEAFTRQLASTQTTALSFEERLGMLIDAEWGGREQRKLDLRLKTDRLRLRRARLPLRLHRPVPARPAPLPGTCRRP